MDKSSIRATALAQRRNLSDAERAAQSHVIGGYLATLPLFSTARVVASYESWPSEPDTRSINNFLLERGAMLLLPAGGVEPSWKLLSKGKVEYGFRDFAQNDELNTAVRAVDGESYPPQVLAEAALIIVPALAVDYQGTRLGRGAGWYDRMLVHKKPGATIISLLFEGEYLSDMLLPRDEHDVPVDYVVTPQAVHKIGPR